MVKLTYLDCGCVYNSANGAYARRCKLHAGRLTASEQVRVAANAFTERQLRDGRPVQTVLEIDA